MIYVINKLVDKNGNYYPNYYKTSDGKYYDITLTLIEKEYYYLIGLGDKKNQDGEGKQKGGVNKKKKEKKEEEVEEEEVKEEEVKESQKEREERELREKTLSDYLTTAQSCTHIRDILQKVAIQSFSKNYTKAQIKKDLAEILSNKDTFIRVKSLNGKKDYGYNFSKIPINQIKQLLDAVIVGGSKLDIMTQFSGFNYKNDEMNTSKVAYCINIYCYRFAKFDGVGKQRQECLTCKNWFVYKKPGTTIPKGRQSMGFNVKYEDGAQFTKQWYLYSESDKNFITKNVKYSGKIELTPEEILEKKTKRVTKGPVKKQFKNQTILVNDTLPVFDIIETVNFTLIPRYFTVKAEPVILSYSSMCYNNFTKSYWYDEKNKKQITERLDGIKDTDRNKYKFTYISPSNGNPLPIQINNKNYSCELKESHTTYPSDIVELDHKDGNHFNNKISNVMPLCKICHGIKTALQNDKGIASEGTKIKKGIEEHLKNKEDQVKTISNIIDKLTDNIYDDVLNFDKTVDIIIPGNIKQTITGFNNDGTPIFNEEITHHRYGTKSMIIESFLIEKIDKMKEDIRSFKITKDEDEDEEDEEEEKASDESVVSVQNNTGNELEDVENQVIDNNYNINM